MSSVMEVEGAENQEAFGFLPRYALVSFSHVDEIDSLPLQSLFFSYIDWY